MLFTVAATASNQVLSTMETQKAITFETKSYVNLSDYDVISEEKKDITICTEMRRTVKKKRGNQELEHRTSPTQHTHFSRSTGSSDQYALS